jgi:polysaccharide pyruvyl transferase WcaK-like protein
MNAWHVYARYYNLGDYALGLGVRNVFARWFSPKLLFKMKDVHSLVFTRQVVRELNNTADLLLVGGGGLIHELFTDDWLFKMPDDVIPELEIPAIFFGLGYNRFKAERDLGPKTLKNLKLLQQKALSFSVRSDGSRERLAALGFEAPEIPDPGFFVDGDYSAPPVPAPYVCVQLANDVKKLRAFDEDHLLRGLTQAVRPVLQRGYSVVLTPHVKDDIALSEALMQRLGSPNVQMWDWFEMLRDENTTKALAYYKHAAFVFAMRGHGQICPIGMGTPVVTIVNHDKHSSLIRKLGLHPLLVEASDPRLGERLLELSGEVERRRDALAAECRRVMDKLTAQMETFVVDLRRKFEARAKNERAPQPPPARTAGKIRRMIREWTM